MMGKNKISALSTKLFHLFFVCSTLFLSVVSTRSTQDGNFLLESSFSIFKINSGFFAFSGCKLGGVVHRLYLSLLFMTTMNLRAGNIFVYYVSKPDSLFLSSREKVFFKVSILQTFWVKASRPGVITRTARNRY